MNTKIQKTIAYRIKKVYQIQIHLLLLLVLLYNVVFTYFEVGIHTIVFISIDVVYHLVFWFVASLDSHF